MQGNDEAIYTVLYTRGYVVRTSEEEKEEKARGLTLLFGKYLTPAQVVS